MTTTSERDVLELMYIFVGDEMYKPLREGNNGGRLPSEIAEKLEKLLDVGVSEAESIGNDPHSSLTTYQAVFMSLEKGVLEGLFTKTEQDEEPSFTVSEKGIEDAIANDFQFVFTITPVKHAEDPVPYT